VAVWLVSLTLVVILMVADCFVAPVMVYPIPSLQQLVTNALHDLPTVNL